MSVWSATGVALTVLAAPVVWLGWESAAICLYGVAIVAIGIDLIRMWRGPWR